MGALFTIVRKWKPHRCPIMDDEKMKMVYTYNEIFISHGKLKFEIHVFILHMFVENTCSWVKHSGKGKPDPKRQMTHIFIHFERC